METTPSAGGPEDGGFGFVLLTYALAHPASNTDSKSNTGTNFIGKSPKRVVNCAELGLGCFCESNYKITCEEKLV